MNRAAVDEEDQSEILKIFELERSSEKMVNPWHSEYKNLDVERKSKGTIFFGITPYNTREYKLCSSKVSEGDHVTC